METKETAKNGVPAGHPNLLNFKTGKNNCRRPVVLIVADQG